MKKIGTALLLLLSLSLLFSCRVRDNNNEEDNSHNVENTLWSPSTDTAVVIADGGGWDVNEFVSSIYNLTGKPVTVTYDASVSYEHEIVFGESDRISSGRAYRQLEGMLEGKEDRSGWCIYALGGSVAIAYDNEVSRDAAIAHFVSEYCKSSTLVMNNGLIASESFDLLTHINELRAEMREKEFAALEQTLGAGTAAAIKSLYSLYTEDIYIWMANLYDPDTGGFYFSNSARDNIGFLPDIESTVQILNFLGSSGLLENYGGSYSKGIPASVREQLVNFAMGLQSDVDGYFYHPQWGDNIINARRGRDLGWATQMLEKFGEKPLYDTPDGIKGSLGAPGSSSEVSLTSKLGQSSVSAASKVISASKSNLPAFLQSMDAWKKYVADLGINTDSYTAGNDLAAMHTQITMAGKEYVDYVIKYLDEHQDPETGLWEPKKTEHQGTTINSYNAINGLFKITHLYYYLGVSVPNAEAAIQSVIDVVLQDSGDTHVCSVYNPWITFDLLLESIESSEGKKRAEEIQSILIENSEALVKATFEKIADYREGDGGFSYRGDKVQLTSQKALVACATTPESDVNATCISTTGIALNIFDTLGVSRVPLYTSADYYYFIKILEDLGTIIKNEPEPVSAESFDDYQGSAGEKEFGMVISPSNSIENSFADKTVTDNKYRFYQSDVVADPSPSSSSDKALLVTTYAGDGDDYATNPLYTFIGVSNSYFMGDCYKFSADIMVKNGTSSFMQLLFSRAMGAAYDSFGLDFQMYEENGERFVRIADYKAGPDGDTDNNIADGIPLGTWFNVSVEVYKIYTEDENEKRTLNIVGKIYVNGKYVGISTSSRVENGAVVDIAMGAVTLVHSRRSNNEIYIDNVKAERTSDTYIAENPLFPVAPEDVPELLPEIEGTHTGGELYNNTESEGKRYGYDNGEKAPGTSKKQDAKAYISPDAFVYYYRLGNENGSHEYVTYSYNSVPEGYSSPIAVLEADIALGNANANNFLVFKFYGGGMRAGLYLNASADGDKIEFRNTVYSTDGAILLPNTWYSLRIEVYNLDSDTVRFKIYINGAFVAEADGLDVSENTKSRVEIQLQYTDADSWIAYDNIYLGYTDTEYVAPPVTEEPPAEGSGSEGGNEEGDGSEGGESVGTSGPLLSGTKGSGAYFNDGSKEGTRSDYEADSAKAPSTSSPDVSELTDGNYVWFHKGGTATKSITYSFGSVPSDRIANVIEFDAAFGNIANSKTFLRILLQGGVCRADMYLKTDASGFVTIGGDSIVSGENISVSQGEWHNYRLEYSLDESDTTLVNVKLFVDNVWQCDMQFACGTVGKERVLFYLQGDVDYFMCIDNVYVGYSSQPFVSGAQ